MLGVDGAGEWREAYRGHTVVTVDGSDFRVYRRNQREAIPALLPPER
jgi:hypothetical protein